MRALTQKLIGASLLLAGAFICATTVAQVAQTKHNLSVSGPGTLTASQETQICIFCHTPHNASPAAPLWNRTDPGSTYIPYSSSTAVAAPGQPTGASILCLSCHDGTVALGNVLSQGTDIPMAGGITVMPPGSGRLGTDLRDDHPISFAYTPGLANQNAELVDPGTLTGAVRLDANGQMQCTACHDPHEDTYGNFLVKLNHASALCTTCHVKDGWLDTAHANANATWNGQPPDPWPDTEAITVADNACDNCHQPHASGGVPRLLRHALEEDNCRACHNANVAAEDVMNVFNQVSVHPIATTQGVHDPAEAAVIGSRHVECVDCHNPHAARADINPVLGALNHVRGVDINGTPVKPLSSDYQLCLRCHGDSPGKPTPRTPRQITQNNVRLEFQTHNPSFHPVAGPGRNPDVPSLIAPLSVNSVISCTDCHNSNAASAVGGTGPDGPHGSLYEPILARQYLTQDPTPESAANYALCYGCHDRNSILNDESFKEHREHIGSGGHGGHMGANGMRLSTPCNVCHDPHGVSATQGNATNNSKLINFDTSVVSPTRGGVLRFESRGRFSGACYLNCHGKEHNPKTY